MDGQTTGPWCRSSFSQQNDCVEMAPVVGGVALRNSNHPDAGTVVIGPDVLGPYLDAVKGGGLDDLTA